MCIRDRHQAFVQAVIDESLQACLMTHQEAGALHTMLRKTSEMELIRIQKKPWKVDAPDDATFWRQVATSLADPIVLEDQHHVALSAILRKIIERYVYEIIGRFRISHYQFCQRAITYTLTKLLLPISLLQGLRSPWKMRARLQEKIHILGAIPQLRELARIGTLVMVPTHCSHLDSLFIAWVMHTLGLPHFIYGAGLNLFNNKFLAYFMNNVGTYKVDRRKKNAPYLNTLKTYSRLALQWGCHSLFYPGGTRSRSGALEQQLKLGLLGTALEAQRHNYQTQGRTARKIFVVPVVLSYHCVLEAPHLIKSHLAAQGLRSAQAPPLHKLLQVANNLLTKDSSMFVSLGKAIDLLGNAVDEEGNSYDAQGAYVDTYQQFLVGDIGTASGEQHERHTQMLGKAIIRTYYQVNCVLTSHVAAFAAFERIKQQHAALSFQDFLQLPPEKIVIPYAMFVHTFGQLRDAILSLYQAGEIQMEPALQVAISQEETLANIAQQGLYNLGLYHSSKPLLQNQAGDITTQNLSTLLYYRNRLQGYSLEKYVS